MDASYPDSRGLIASHFIALTLRDNDAATVLDHFQSLRAMEEPHAPASS